MKGKENRIKHSLALPDYSVTSGTGLPMPDRNGDAVCTPFHHQQYGRAWYHFPPRAVLTCRVYPSPSFALWCVCNPFNLCKVFF
jgi:hypothetical protein